MIGMPFVKIDPKRRTNDKGDIRSVEIKSVIDDAGPRAGSQSYREALCAGLMTGPDGNYVFNLACPKTFKLLSLKRSSGDLDDFP